MMAEADIQNVFGRLSVSAIAREWFRDWGGKLTILYALLVVFHFLFVTFHFGGEDFIALLSNVIAVAIYSGPCILAWRASRNPLLPRRTRNAWLFVSLADLSFLLGEATWLYLENFLGIRPFPSWADAGYLLFYPLMMAGLLSLVDRFQSGEEQLNFWLDAGVILIAGGSVLWYFLLGPIADASDGSSLKTVLSLAYPIGDLVLLLAIASLLLRRSTVGSRGPINILLAGVVINFLADFVFGYQSLAGTYRTGNVVDALFTLACFLVMMGAHLQHLITARPTVVTNTKIASASRSFWVSYVAIGVVYLVLVRVAFEHPASILDYVIIIAGVVTAIVTFRQFMFVRENTKANRALTELEDRIQGIYSASTDAIGLATFEGTLTEVNDSFVRLTGYSRDEIVGAMRYQDFVPDDYLDQTVTPEMAIEGGKSLEYEWDLIRSDGTLRRVTTTLYAVDDAKGEPAAMAIVVRDISERRSLERQLIHQAMHDSLTGLANRSLLRDRIKRALRRARRRKTRIVVLFLDLDNFKPVNDTLGHAAGDSLLVTVAERLNACIRASDTAARIGGDEFAILVDDIEKPDEELFVTRRVLETIKAPISINGKDVFVGASIGIALSSDDTESADELLQNADVAMYSAKKKGHDCYAIFEQAMHAAVVRRAELETELRGALDNNEFEIHYQPIVDIVSGEMVAVEALLRWNHPRGLEVGPAEFIPIAEQTNLITSIGQWVLEESCRQAANWIKQHKPDLPFSIAVNISSRQFQDPSFVSSLKEAYSVAGLPASQLILEITESLILQNTELTVETLGEIRRLGVRIAVDDFGTGYSSLSYLHRFPVDILKIDRAFVEKVARDREGAAMAKAIISMSETLHLVTIAEGLEAPDQIDTLRELGCDWGQGYYFAKPLRTDAMCEYIRQYSQRGSHCRSNKEDHRRLAGPFESQPVLS